MGDDSGFDEYWDIKKANGMNVTENRLYDSMCAIGLEPKCQYQIGLMTVDFAFPNEMVVIEVNGPYHESFEQTERDKKRWFVLHNDGWQVKSYRAKSVYEHSDFIAVKIAELLGKKVVDKGRGPEVAKDMTYRTVSRKDSNFPKVTSKSKSNTKHKHSLGSKAFIEDYSESIRKIKKKVDEKAVNKFMGDEKEQEEWKKDLQEEIGGNKSNPKTDAQLFDAGIGNSVAYSKSAKGTSSSFSFGILSRFIWEFLKEAAKNVFFSVVGVLLFPLAFGAVAYLLLGAIIIIFMVLTHILGLLFAFDANAYISNIDSTLFFGSFHKLFEAILFNLVPFVFHLVYFPETRPIVMAITIIVAVIVSFIKTRKKLEYFD